MTLVNSITTFVMIINYFLLPSFSDADFTTTPSNAIKNNTEVLEYVLLDGEAMHPCTRPCNRNQPPMACRFQFTLEWYQSMSKACYDCPRVREHCFRRDCVPTDGTKRPILVANRRLPGPALQVCLGDEIIVDVENGMTSEGTTIHWHGQHQRFSPYMDGVPFVTQCPIEPGAAFRYHFRARQPGTHFWHSHSGLQRGNGAFGALIVKDPEDPHQHLYDHDLAEHVIILLDWAHVSGLNKFVAHMHSNGNNKPANLLVNGLGRGANFTAEDNSTVYVPYAKFVVEEGGRYRFRVINAGFLNCPIEISIDNHTLTVISSDGFNFEPKEVESLVTYAGERFDFILNAKQEPGTYWMKFQGLMDCDARFTSAHQAALLHYKGFEEDYSTLDEIPPDYYQSHNEGLQLNPLNHGTEDDNQTYSILPNLKSLDKWDDSLKEKPDYQYYISYDFYKINNPYYHRSPYYGFYNVTDVQQRVLTPQLNYITMKLQPFPLLPQRSQITDNSFCNESTVKNCDKEFCECTHVIQVPLGAVVELILIDKGVAYDANHPFHLHGHAFRVVALERLSNTTTVQDVQRHDREGLIHRNLVDPPIKDTVTVPDGGYTVLRFKASNPGFWLFHCHIEFHVEVGMGLVFQVGTHEQMPQIPKNFPRCGNYLPNPQPESCYHSAGGFWGKLQVIVPVIFGEHCSDSAQSIPMPPSIIVLLVSLTTVICRQLFSL